MGRVVSRPPPPWVSQLLYTRLPHVGSRLISHSCRPLNCRSVMPAMPAARSPPPGCAPSQPRAAVLLEAIIKVVMTAWAAGSAHLQPRSTHQQ